MRTRTLALASAGSALLALGLLTAALGPTQQSGAAPSYKVVVPGIAGDDASGLTYATPNPSTPTPSGTATNTPTPTPVAGSCSYNRVAVKTLSDPAAAFNRTPQGVNVSLLGLLQRPSGITEARVPGSETAIYTVPVELTSMEENTSREIVLLVTDPVNVKSMLVYFPHRDCMTGASDADKGAMIKARADVIAACGKPPASGAKLLRGRATITGAALWGVQGVPGAAPNGMEIHPVTAFAYSSNFGCDPNDPNATPPPTATPTPALYRLVVTISGGTNSTFHPGDSITVSAQTEPAISGLVCLIKYFKPSPDVETIPVELGLPTMTTDTAGRAAWTFNLPNPSPYGRGTIEVDCGTKAGNNNYWVEAP